MDTLSGKKNKTLANFFSLSLLQIGNYVLPMITLPIISRIIGPENYGAINYAFAYVGYFVLLINAGFDLYGTRLILQNRDNPVEINKVFSRIIAAKTTLLVIAGFLFLLSIYFVGPLREQKLITFFTFILCVGWVINPSWLYHGMQDSRRYAVFSFVSKLLFSVLVVLAVQHREDYIYHPLITSLSHVLVSFISCYYAMKKYGLKLCRVSRSEIKRTLNENRKLSLIWWISNQAQSTNLVIAGFFLLPLDLGYYSAALRLIFIIQSIISMPLNTVLFPYIGEAFLNNYEQGMKRLKKIFPLLTFIALGMTLGTLLFSKYVIHGFYGAEFAGAEELLKIFSIVLFFSTINGALGQQVLLNLKLDSVYMKFVMTGFFLNIIFLFLFIHLKGGVGAAWAWPCSEIVVFFIYVIYLRLRKVPLFHYANYNPVRVFGSLFQLVKLRTAK